MTDAPTAPWKQPLVQFLAFGVVVVTAQVWWGAGPGASLPSEGDESVIVVDEALRAMLERQLRATLDREPVAGELDDAIEAWVRSEVLVRSARSRGLQEGDATIRAHLARKMAYLLEASEVVQDPPDAELEALYDAMADRWRLDTRVTVRQVFVAGVDELAARGAEGLAEALRAGADPVTLASDPAPGGPVLRSRTPERLMELFGGDFAEAVLDAEIGAWQVVLGIEGHHVVSVLERREGRSLTFDEARARVLAHWRRTRSEALADRAFEELRGTYDIRGWTP